LRNAIKYFLDSRREAEQIYLLLDEITKILPFKAGLGYLFRLYLTTGWLPGVINHYFSHRYLEQKDMVDSAVAEIFVRDVLGDMARLQKQEAITRQILRAIVERYGSRYSFYNLSRENDPQGSVFLHMTHHVR